MNISFTGHRDKRVNPDVLAEIAARYPGATWIHGGAGGFDAQVSKFARAHGISQVCIRPDYQRNGRGAPFIRNREIVNLSPVLFACYDGRNTGGTCYTVNYARKSGKNVVVLKPYTE